MSAYCSLAPGHAVHHSYHAHEYGFPLQDDVKLFERLSLEIMQAGLSWELILKRRDGMCAAFNNFEPTRIAKYNDKKITSLLNDERIIRNRLKVTAIIHNAQVVVDLQKEDGFAGWLAHHHPLTKPQWVKLMRKHFRFMGPEIVGEFLMSIGYLPGAHHDKCPVFRQIRAAQPAWMQAQKAGFQYL